MPPTVTVTTPALDLATMPARELAALVRVGRLSAQDLLAPLLHRLAVRAPVLADTRHAPAAAVRLDALRRHGVALGALAAVPVLVRSDLAAAHLLQAAGAIVLVGRDDDGPAVAGAAVADRLVPVALVAGGATVSATAAAHGLVALDLDVAGERVGVLARDVRDAGLLLGVLGASYGPAVELTLPAGTTPADRVIAEDRLRTTVARLQLG